MSNWHPQPSLQLGLGHWTTVPLTGPTAVGLDLGGRGLVSEAADGEESTLAVGCIHSPCPHPTHPCPAWRSESQGQKGFKARVPSGPSPHFKDWLRML